MNEIGISENKDEVKIVKIRGIKTVTDILRKRIKETKKDK